MCRTYMTMKYDPEWGREHGGGLMLMNVVAHGTRHGVCPTKCMGIYVF